MRTLVAASVPIVLELVLVLESKGLGNAKALFSILVKPTTPSV